MQSILATDILCPGSLHLKSVIWQSNQHQLPSWPPQGAHLSCLTGLPHQPPAILFAVYPFRHLIGCRNHPHVHLALIIIKRVCRSLCVTACVWKMSLIKKPAMCESLWNHTDRCWIRAMDMMQFSVVFWSRLSMSGMSVLCVIPVFFLSPLGYWLLSMLDFTQVNI